MSNPWADLDRPPLDVRALNRALVDGGLWREIRVVDETGSTNADVAEAARFGEPEGLVLVAEHQTAAKGRLDRSWSAPARSHLSFSVLLRPDGIPANRWPLLPLLAGVAVASAVGRVSELTIGLKWPNDLMVGERKLAGILAERVESSDGAAAVIGVGLNVTVRDDELPVPTGISLATAGAACTDRDTLLRAALRAIADRYLAWRIGGDGGESGDDALLADYRSMCVTLGRDVRVELPADRVVTGAAVDVDTSGALVVETPSGPVPVSAGDVVHVR